MEAPPAPFTLTDLLVVASSPCLPQTPPSPVGGSAVPLSRASPHHRICPRETTGGDRGGSVLATGLYQADEEVAGLLQDTGYVGRRVVVHTVTPEQADSAEHLGNEGPQLRDQSLVSEGGCVPPKPLGLCCSS